MVPKWFTATYWSTLWTFWMIFGIWNDCSFIHNVKHKYFILFTWGHYSKLYFSVVVMYVEPLLLTGNFYTSAAAWRCQLLYRRWAKQISCSLTQAPKWTVIITALVSSDKACYHTQWQCEVATDGHCNKSARHCILHGTLLCTCSKKMSPSLNGTCGSQIARIQIRWIKLLGGICSSESTTAGS